MEKVAGGVVLGELSRDELELLTIWLAVGVERWGSVHTWEELEGKGRSEEWKKQAAVWRGLQNKVFEAIDRGGGRGLVEDSSEGDGAPYWGAELDLLVEIDMKAQEYDEVRFFDNLATDLAMRDVHEMLKAHSKDSSQPYPGPMDVMVERYLDHFEENGLKYVRLVQPTEELAEPAESGV